MIFLYRTENISQIKLFFITISIICLKKFNFYCYRVQRGKFYVVTNGICSILILKISIYSLEEKKKL